jgi:hypothetical protein
MICAGVLVGLVAAALFGQAHLGLADNGDFKRELRVYSPKPVGFDVNLPPRDTPERHARFFRFYLPGWEFRWHAARPHSSIHLFWLPGAALNRLFLSADVLLLPWLSFLPRLLLVVLYAVVAFAAALQPLRRFASLALALLVPLGFMLTTTEYAALLNSGYTETASLVFLLLFLAGLALLGHRGGVAAQVLCLGSLLCLAAARAGNIYWALLGPAAFVLLWRGRRDPRPSPAASAAVFAELALFIGIAAFLLTHLQLPANRYNSLYYGALRFSRQPAAHLERLGLQRTAPCVGVLPWKDEGRRLIETGSHRLRFANTVRVLVHEPLVYPRLLLHAFRNMQDISLDYLGRYPRGLDRPSESRFDPKTHARCQETRCWLRRRAAALNLWARLKYAAFPRGALLVLILAFFLATFASLSLRARPAGALLARLGLLVTLAIPLDVTVAVLGDGCYELIKHLLLANVLFDLALILFAASTALTFAEGTKSRPATQSA